MSNHWLENVRTRSRLRRLGTCTAQLKTGICQRTVALKHQCTQQTHLHI